MIFDTFQEVLIISISSVVAQETDSPGVAARTLACIADVLGAMAGGKGGLRSGPAGNQRWSHAFALLEVICSFLSEY